MNRLLLTPSPITSRASISEMPLRMNDASWREKCMISTRGTRCGVSSMLKLLRAVTLRTSRFWRSSASRSASSLAASAFALTSEPSGRVAT
jgi:hypothetical protein